ncbi:MAG TPA: Ig-like domain-containing protein [Gammaproteobacteria bacterium]|jgi:hypothetical protein
MKKQAGIVGVTVLLMSLLLQGCGSSSAADGQGVSPDVTVSTSTGSDAAPTLTFTGFAVVQVDGALSGKVVAFFSEDMDASSINTQTFKVAGPDSKPIPGSVLYIGVTGVFTPSVRFAADTTYTATLTTGVHSLSGVPLAKAHIWSFTTPSPSQLTGVLTRIASTSPTAEQTDVPLDAGVNVSFRQLMDPTTINGDTLTLVDADGARVQGAVHYSGLTASFVPSQSLRPNTTYKATVASAAKSLSGVSMDSDHAWIFTTGTDGATLPPQVVSTSPLIGDTGVSLDSTVVMDFNEAMDANTVNTANIVVSNGQGWQVDGSIAYSGDTAVFTPAAPLSPATTYTVRIGNGVISAGGTPLADAYSWTFTTANFGSSTAPTVVFTSPSLYQNNVWSNTTISIAFSAVLDPATLNTSTVLVTDQDGNPVAGSVSYLGNVAIFTPDDLLGTGTQYTVTLTSGIEGADGASLEEYSWTFTTAWPM